MNEHQHVCTPVWAKVARGAVARDHGARGRAWLLRSMAVLNLMMAGEFFCFLRVRHARLAPRGAPTHTMWRV